MHEAQTITTQKMRKMWVEKTPLPMHEAWTIAKRNKR
jgi:hypothetical protein